MLQHRLSKNLKLTRVNITSQKDIEEIMDLCLVLCKLIVNRFDCYVTHFYRLVIYPIPSCFGSTYQHLWENIDKILLSLNDLFLANGIIFSLSSIKKITHNFDDFDFLFYANEPLDSYLLNLQLEFIDDSTEEEEIDLVDDETNLPNYYLEGFRPEFKYWQVPYQYLEPIHHELWKLADDVISHHAAVTRGDTFNIDTVSQQFELTVLSSVYMYRDSFNFFGPHYFDILNLGSNAFDFYPVLELVLCVDNIDTPWLEEYWDTYDNEFSEVRVSSFDKLLILILDVLGDGYKIHLFDLISDEVYIYLFGDYLDSEGLEVDYLLAYLAYCFFYILYTGEALDVKTTLSGYFFMSISQASNISIFDLQFCHDFIYIFGNSSHNYSLNFYLNFDEDFIITTMGFSSYVNKITRALLNEKSIFSLDIHGNFYYRSEAGDGAYSFKFDFYQGMFYMWFTNLLVFDFYVDYKFMRYVFDELLKQLVLSILKLYNYQFFRFNAIQFEDYYLDLDDLSLTKYQGSSLQDFKYRCFAYFPIHIKSCLLKYIYFDQSFNYQLSSHCNMPFLLYIYLACFIMQLARPFDKILPRQFFITNNKFTHFTFDFVFTLLNDLYSTVVNGPIQRMLDLIRYKLDKHDESDDFLFTYVIQQFANFDDYFITGLVEEGIDSMNAFNNTAFNFGYLFNYKTSLIFRPFIFVDYKAISYNDNRDITTDIYKDILNDLNNRFPFIDLIISSNVLNNSNIYHFIKHFDIDKTILNSLFFVLDLFFISFNYNDISDRFTKSVSHSKTLNHDNYKLVPQFPLFCLSLYSYLLHYNPGNQSVVTTKQKHYLFELLQPNDWRYVMSKLYPQMQSVLLNSLSLKSFLDFDVQPNVRSYSSFIYSTIEDDIKLFSLFCTINFIDDKLFFILFDQLTSQSLAELNNSRY